MPQLTPIFQFEILPGSVFSPPFLDWSHPALTEVCKGISAPSAINREKWTPPDGKPAHLSLH